MKSKKFVTFLFCLTIFSTKIFACTLQAGSNLLEENRNEALTYVAISFIFFLATSYLYFKKGRKGIVLLFAGFIIVGFTFLNSGVNGGDCGDNAVYLGKQDVLLTFICFLFQFITWLFRKRMTSAELT